MIVLNMFHTKEVHQGKCKLTKDMHLGKRKSQGGTLKEYMFWLVMTVEIRDKKSRCDWVTKMWWIFKEVLEAFSEKRNYSSYFWRPKGTFSMQGFVHKWKQTWGSSAKGGTKENGEVQGIWWKEWTEEQVKPRTWVKTKQLFLQGNKHLFLVGEKEGKNGISSVQFSSSVRSNSLQPHESQHARPRCPSPTPGVYSNSCPSSRWCHQAISFSVVTFSSCLQSLPASESFPVSQLFAWGGQSIGVSASASVLPMNTQDRSPLGWTGWISLQSKGLSRVLSNTTVQKHPFFSTQLSSQSNSYIHTWPLEKP